jgi:hypothetical protein
MLPGCNLKKVFGWEYSYSYPISHYLYLYLYENFKETILENLGAKYKYLSLNYPFKISRLGQESQNQNIPVYEEPIKFAQAWSVIRDMLVKFQNETGQLDLHTN